MIPFQAGQQVVCIDDQIPTIEGTMKDPHITAGCVYTVREIGEFSHPAIGTIIGVRLVGIKRDNKLIWYGLDDMPYDAARFKPVAKDPLASLRNLLISPVLPDGGFEEPKRKVEKKVKETVE
mgnify:CR=1 FL=1